MELLFGLLFLYLILGFFIAIIQAFMLVAVLADKPEAAKNLIDLTIKNSSSIEKFYRKLLFLILFFWPYHLFAKENLLAREIRILQK